MRENLNEIERKILTELTYIIDPEVGFDIVNLGLIYDIKFCGNYHAKVTMTLSTKSCPMHDMILGWVEAATLNVEGIKTCEINLVWEPQWNINMASDMVKQALMSN